MPINSVKRAKTIVVPLTPDSGEEIVTVYESSGLSVGSELMPGYTVVSYNCFIKNLKAFSQINSLDEVALPDFEITDSETTKLQKVTDIEWNSPRKQLNLFIATDVIGWTQVGSTSVLNPSGYPFRIYNLLDLFTDNLFFELGENGKIGVQVQDVGYGALIGSDSIVIHGSYNEELFVQSAPEQTYVTIPPITVNIGTTGTVINPPIELPEEDEDMANWLIKSENYTATAGDKVVMDATSSTIVVKLPSSPTIGNTVKVFGIIIPNTSNYAVIDFNGSKFAGDDYGTVGLGNSGVVYDFIYHGVDRGWISNMPIILS